MTSTEAELDPLRRPENRSEESLRQMSWYTPRTRRRTVYEDVTCDTQPSVTRYAGRGWCLHFEDGRSLWWEDSTELRSVDWYAFRDPGQLWERPFFQDGSGWEKGIEQSGSQALNDRLFDDFKPHGSTGCARTSRSWRSSTTGSGSPRRRSTAAPSATRRRTASGSSRR